MNTYIIFSVVNMPEIIPESMITF